MHLIGVDTGGTFTDFVCFDGVSIQAHKVRSTPDCPEKAIMQGLTEMGLSDIAGRLVHGSTVATNAILEGQGAKTVYITNRGFKDVLALGRQSRRELYNLRPVKEHAPVPDHLLIETGGRFDARGEIIEDLTNDDLQALSDALKLIQPESVAINLLFSFLNPKFEREIAGHLGTEYFVSCSSTLLREYKEYERGITTWLNARIGPLVQGYLKRLDDQCHATNISVMRSSGDTCNVDMAGQEAVHLFLSGPAGGLAGAAYLGRQLDFDQLMTFDMGGTSTDVALIDGSIALTSQAEIGGYPVAVPMVDMHTIGAGGGSIAYVDEGGGLQVGPRSAGADPGPVCYGLGGFEPTVTDANLVAGRLPKEHMLAGELKLNFELAHETLTALALQLGLGSAEQAAMGIIELANESMLSALKVISIQRGHDPRDFCLVSFGGAGGLHVCDLASQLDISRIMLPNHAGVLSALGMLVAPHGRQFSRTINQALPRLTDEIIEARITDIADEAYADLTHEGLDRDELKMNVTVDLCYQGQGTYLNLPWQNIHESTVNFHRLHEKRYGHRLDSALQLINIRVGLKSIQASIQLPKTVHEQSDVQKHSVVYGYADPVPVVSRAELSYGVMQHGPMIIYDRHSTCFIHSHWAFTPDEYGNLHITRNGWMRNP